MLSKLILAATLIFTFNVYAQTSPMDAQIEGILGYQKVAGDPAQPIQMVENSLITADQVPAVAAAVKAWLCKYLSLNVDLNDVLTTIPDAKAELLLAINSALPEGIPVYLVDDQSLKISFPKSAGADQAIYLGVQADQASATFCFPCSVDGKNPQWGVVKK